MTLNFPFKPSCLLLLTAIATSANAMVTMPISGNLTNGDFKDIQYGPGDLGAVFQLNALLFVDEVSSTAQIVEQLTTFTKLKVDKTAFGPVGLGTGLAEFDYRVTNVDSSAQSNLRFMTVFGIDGNPTTLLESVAETWGAKLPSDPSRRQTLAWDGVPGPSSLKISGLLPTALPAQKAAAFRLHASLLPFAILSLAYNGMCRLSIPARVSLYAWVYRMTVSICRRAF